MWMTPTERWARRHLRVVLDADGAARRPGALPGWVVLGSLVIGAVLAVAGAVLR